MTQMNSFGRMFIISGPSGSGKDAVIVKVLKDNPNLKFSISYTTRSPRGSEKEDGKYNFVCLEEFEKMISQDEFLEYASYCGNYYGTSKTAVESWLNEGFNVLVEVDVVGQEKIAENNDKAISVFLMPPSLKVLEKRLKSRKTEDDATIAKRLEAAKSEILCAERFDHIVINDDLKQAVKEIDEIIESGHETGFQKIANQSIIMEVLKDA